MSQRRPRQREIHLETSRISCHRRRRCRGAARETAGAALAALLCCAFLQPAMAGGATLSFVSQSYTIGEEEADLQVSVQLALDDSSECAGQIRTFESSFRIFPRESGSAEAGADFNPASSLVPLGISGTPPLPPIGRTLDGLIIDDPLEEGTEQFELELQLVAAGLRIECLPTEGDSFPLTVATGPPATVVILDDDTPPFLQIGDAFCTNETCEEGDAGTTTGFEFPVTLSRASTATVTVQYETAGGTAAAGSDFTPITGTLTFAPMETVQTVTVEVLGDDEAEGDETFFVQLSEPLGATLGNSFGAATIVDDDEPPDPNALRLRIVSGNGQTGQVNQTLEPLVVEVTTASGRPVPEIAVEWEVTEGEAELADRETVTDDDGVAENAVTLGPQPGQVVIGARIEGAAVSFELTAVLELVDSDADLDEVSMPVAEALDEICANGDVSADLRQICNDLGALPAGQLDQALRAIAPEEAAAQGTVMIAAQTTQLRNVEARTVQLRAGGGSGGSGGGPSAQLSFNLRGVSLSSGALARLAAPASTEHFDLDYLFAQDSSDDAAGARKAPAPAGSEPAGRLGFFVNGSIGFGERPATSRETAFDLTTRGLTAGVDYRLRDGLFLGGAVGYLSSTTDLSGGSEVDVEGYSLTAYGTYFKPSFHLSAVVGYGRDQLELTRAIDFPGLPQVAEGDPDGSQIAISLGGGWTRQSEAISIGGFVGADLVEASIDGYQERGAPGFNLAVDDQKIRSLLASARLQISYAASLKMGVLLPTLRFAYLHEFEDDSRLTIASFVDDPLGIPFATPTANPDRDYFRLGLGVSATFARGRVAFLFVEQDLDRDDLDYYQLSGGFRLEL